jgi:hypothetical protein
MSLDSLLQKELTEVDTVKKEENTEEDDLMGEEG